MTWIITDNPKYYKSVLNIDNAAIIGITQTDVFEAGEPPKQRYDVCLMHPATKNAVSITSITSETSKEIDDYFETLTDFLSATLL